ncbi:MAG TPA: preprotein translocase subunit SecA, partial [Bacteroidetes bacterium]|nr:preprotein translocase subunit SecA [Bacteroidota bacterium]
QDELKARLLRILQISPPSQDEWKRYAKPDEWREYLVERAMSTFDAKRVLYGEERFDYFVRWVVLHTVDDNWKEHLYAMDRLKEGVGLRAYGQKDPLIEFKREGFEMFAAMLETINEESLRIIFNSVISEPTDRRPTGSQRLSYIHKSVDAPSRADIGDEDGATSPNAEHTGKKQPIRVEKTPGRNDPCPCGSGKKYKKCCGA